MAAGFAFDPQAGIDASLYKLSRVAMLAPACAVLALWWPRRAGAERADSARKSHAPFPMFVALFVVMVLVNSWVAMPQSLHATFTTADSDRLADAMVAMGLQTRLLAG